MKRKIWLVTRHCFFVTNGIDYACAFDPSSTLVFTDEHRAFTVLNEMVDDECELRPGYKIKNHLSSFGFVSLESSDGQTRVLFKITENILIDD